MNEDEFAKLLADIKSNAEDARNWREKRYLYAIYGAIAGMWFVNIIWWTSR